MPSGPRGARGDRPPGALRFTHVRLLSGLALPIGFAGLVIGSAPLAAAPSAQLTRVFQAGVDAYRLGKYDDARTQLEKARSLDPKLPGPHRFLAAVAQAQQRWADCIAETRRALQLNPQSQEVNETRKLHDSCRASDGRPLYRAELGDGAAITVTANVTGATVRIAGLRYGGTPVEPRLIKPGAIKLDVDKPGYKPAHVAVDALPGIVTDVEVTLEPVDAKPAETKPAETKPADAKPADAKPAGSKPVEPKPAETRPVGSKR